LDLPPAFQDTSAARFLDLLTASCTGRTPLHTLVPALATPLCAPRSSPLYHTCIAWFGRTSSVTHTHAVLFAAYTILPLRRSLYIAICQCFTRTFFFTPHTFLAFPHWRHTLILCDATFLHTRFWVGFLCVHTHFALPTNTHHVRLHHSPLRFHYTTRLFTTVAVYTFTYSFVCLRTLRRYVPSWFISLRIRFLAILPFATATPRFARTSPVKFILRFLFATYAHWNTFVRFTHHVRTAPPLHISHRHLEPPYRRSYFTSCSTYRTFSRSFGLTRCVSGHVACCLLRLPFPAPPCTRSRRMDTLPPFRHIHTHTRTFHCLLYVSAFVPFTTFYRTRTVFTFWLRHTLGRLAAFRLHAHSLTRSLHTARHRSVYTPLPHTRTFTSRGSHTFMFPRGHHTFTTRLFTFSRFTPLLFARSYHSLHTRTVSPRTLPRTRSFTSRLFGVHAGFTLHCGSRLVSTRRRFSLRFVCYHARTLDISRTFTFPFAAHFRFMSHHHLRLHLHTI